MTRPSLLPEDELKIYLEQIPDWFQDDIIIKKEIVTSNFATAVGFVNSVAVFAESMDHHPNITLYGWNKIRIELSTHDQGGLTILDIDLAKKIDSIKID